MTSGATPRRPCWLAGKLRSEAPWTRSNLILKPDETEPGSAEIYVDGHIDGRPYRFLLDTGAARSSVLADEYTLTFPSAEKHASSGVFAASSADVITVPGITVGPIARQDFSLVRARWTALARTH